jgi:hypothetical protein
LGTTAINDGWRTPHSPLTWSRKLIESPTLKPMSSKAQTSSHTPKRWLSISKEMDVDHIPRVEMLPYSFSDPPRRFPWDLLPRYPAATNLTRCAGNAVRAVMPRNMAAQTIWGTKLFTTSSASALSRVSERLVTQGSHDAHLSHCVFKALKTRLTENISSFGDYSL